jgi:signal transduction histidine kinase
LVNGEVTMSSTLGSHVDQLRIAPGMRSLDFSFTAISFTHPEQTRFRHILEGSDLDWVESDTDRREHYGPLAPGRYRFRVIAANADGIWNEVGDSLTLVVATPFWRSWWFVGLAVGTSIALIWLAARYVSFRRLQARLRVSEQRRAMERERTRIAQDMHDEIGSKLTRISFLSEAARNAGAGETVVGPQVTSIATTSRELLQALDEIVWAVNPRNDNLEHLAGYLEQYARDYFQGTPVECRISVPDQLPLVSLGAETRHNVFLAFEEALSNALQHAQATEVAVEMRIRPQAFELLVRDNGCGFQVRSKHSSLGHDGLRNMKERLHSIGGLCMIASEPGRGTTIRLRVFLPVNTKVRASKAAN